MLEPRVVKVVVELKKVNCFFFLVPNKMSRTHNQIKGCFIDNNTDLRSCGQRPLSVTSREGE